MDADTLLYVIALILAVISLIPQVDSRLGIIAVILVCIGLLVGADIGGGKG